MDRVRKENWCYESLMVEQSKMSYGSLDIRKGWKRTGWMKA